MWGELGRCHSTALTGGDLAYTNGQSTDGFSFLSFASTNAAGLAAGLRALGGEGGARLLKSLWLSHMLGLDTRADVMAPFMHQPASLWAS